MSLSLRKQIHQQNKTKKRKKKKIENIFQTRVIDADHDGLMNILVLNWNYDFVSIFSIAWRGKHFFFFLENAINNKQKLKSSSIYPVRFIPSFSIIRPLLLNVCTVQWIACVRVCVVSVCVMILLTCVCPLEKGKWIKSWNWKRIYLESRFSFFFCLSPKQFRIFVCIDWTFLSWNKKKKNFNFFFLLSLKSLSVRTFLSSSMS